MPLSTVAKTMLSNIYYYIVRRNVSISFFSCSLPSCSCCVQSFEVSRLTLIILDVYEAWNEEFQPHVAVCFANLKNASKGKRTQEHSSLTWPLFWLTKLQDDSSSSALFFSYPIILITFQQQQHESSRSELTCVPKANSLNNVKPKDKPVLHNKLYSSMRNNNNNHPDVPYINSHLPIKAFPGTPMKQIKKSPPSSPLPENPADNSSDYVMDSAAASFYRNMNLEMVRDEKWRISIKYHDKVNRYRFS